jgi:3-oxoisoapionate kinase
MTPTPSLPAGVLLSFYGDDLTGSSAVMELLSFAGLPTVMFLAPPSAADLVRFSAYRAIGVAGIARSQSPEWMDRELPGVFSALEKLGAPINHYKTCSTLDSSPTTGSIGRAIDIGVPIFVARQGAAAWQPVVIAAPGIGRYQAFGNLFAVYDGQNYRLDRHPVMQRHPATPMDEADVARHLGKQTERAIGLVDLAAIKAGRGSAQLSAQIDAGRSLVSFDVIDDETLIWAGREIWEGRGAGLFAIGSQGIEYALCAYWRDAGVLAPQEVPPRAAAAEQIVVASGSVSPGTAGQIAWAEEHGFDVVTVDPARAVTQSDWDGEIARGVEAAKTILSAGRSPIIATARGPDDASITRMTAAAAGQDAQVLNARIGTGLGDAIGALVAATKVRRVVVAGGDSSGYAAQALGIRALTALAPLAPGSPLCLAVADAAPIDGLEISLKGGQMGAEDYFGIARAGGAGTYKEN